MEPLARLVVCSDMISSCRLTRGWWRGLLALAVLPALALQLGEAHHGPHWDAVDAAAEYLVFAEAAHPWEAPHLDAATAPVHRSCTACLHRLKAGTARLASPAGLSAPVRSGSLPASAQGELRSLPLTGASPRGPPPLGS